MTLPTPTPPPNTSGAPTDTAATQLAAGENAQNIRLVSTGDPEQEDNFVQVPGSWRLPEEDGGA
ncbi:MAG: hypothetical protein AAB759_03040 [Patescibacteria group bacterium]